MIVRIPDADGSVEHDLFVVVPEGRDAQDVALAVSGAVAQVRAINPEDYDAEDLDEALAVHGLTLAEVVTASEDF